MNVLLCNEKDYTRQVGRLSAASSLFDPVIEERTRAIVEGVRDRGDDALVEYAARFDGVTLTPAHFAVTQAELMTASLKADTDLRRAVAAAHRNITTFSVKSLRKNWAYRNAQGARTGEKFDPFHRVGLYVPGGTAPLVSSALMTVALAQVAGCREIAVCTPCGPNRAINAALLYAVRKAGATEIYRLGGAHAIAALALGTETIQPVQKIFGPGNAYVVAAKRLLFGRVAIDLLPGPSEVLVLADESANSAWVAADLLAQAEHGSGHERVWMVTPSLRLIRSVTKEIDRQLPKLSRRALVEKALANNGWLIQVRTMAEGVDLANRIAPEHCEIVARQSSRLARQIVTAGAIFLGSWSPTVLGDYMAGPSHTLPTGGAGACFAGLTVDQFQRRTSVVEYNRSALVKSLQTVQELAKLEGLDAHGRSAAIRLDHTPARSKRKKSK